MNVLKEKVALITGCSGGIGRETAIRFAEEGANLAICARTQSKLEETAEICRKKGAEVLAVVCDITDRAQLENLVKQTADRFGRIDILINNAVDAKPGIPFLQQTEADLMTVFKSGYLATWRLMQLCYPYLKESHGKIINFASPAGLTGTEGYAAYASVKEAIRGLSKVAAREWGKEWLTSTASVRRRSLRKCRRSLIRFRKVSVNQKPWALRFRLSVGLARPMLI